MVLLQRLMQYYALLSRPLQIQGKRSNRILSTSAAGERTIHMILELITSEHAAWRQSSKGRYRHSSYCMQSPFLILWWHFLRPGNQKSGGFPEKTETEQLKVTQTGTLTLNEDCIIQNPRKREKKNKIVLIHGINWTFLNELFCVFYSLFK